MTTEELNKTLSSITGKAVDFTKQAAEAAAAFWKNLSDGAGAFAADTRSTAEGAVTRAGEFIKGVWDMAITYILYINLIGISSNVGIMSNISMVSQSVYPIRLKADKESVGSNERRVEIELVSFYSVKI